MATLSVSASPFCLPEEDPFLLLEACGKAIEGILRGHAGWPLRRSWIDRPYGEEEIDGALAAEAEVGYRQVVEAEGLLMSSNTEN